MTPSLEEQSALVQQLRRIAPQMKRMTDLQERSNQWITGPELAVVLEAAADQLVALRRAYLKLEHETVTVANEDQLHADAHANLHIIAELIRMLRRTYEDTSTRLTAVQAMHRETVAHMESFRHAWQATERLVHDIHALLVTDDGAHGPIPNECDIIENVRALIRDRHTLQREVDVLREQVADYDYALLSRVSKTAAGHTDMYTWALCRLADIAQLREDRQKERRLRHELAQALERLSNQAARDPQ